jgi:hypothetical protein
LEKKSELSTKYTQKQQSKQHSENVFIHKKAENKSDKLVDKSKYSRLKKASRMS